MSDILLNFILQFFVISCSISSTPSNFSKPLVIYGTSREVSLEMMLETAKNYNLSIYLPREVPKNLELTSIYLKESLFIAIVVYSAESNKDYKTAELTIEIAPVDLKWIPTYSEPQSEAAESQDKTAMEINT